MSRSPLLRSAAAVFAGVVMASACAPLPSTGPELATELPGGDAGETAPEPELTEGEAPPWESPAQSGNWGPCPPAGAPEPPDDIEAEMTCSVLEAPVTAQAPAVIDVPMVRLLTPDTPEGSPPLVVVAGPDERVADELAELAAAAPDIVAEHPLVGVDHRGTDDVPDTCLGSQSHSTLAGIADHDVDPVGAGTQRAMSEVANECLDALAGTALEFGADGAARDLAMVREHWQVPGLALLAVGDGSRTALRYASENPGGTSLLALDSPAPLDTSEETTTRAALDGSEAALRAWAGMCTRAECGSGAAQEKVDALSGHVDAAARGEAAVPAARLVDTIRVALRDIAGASDPAAADGDRLLGALADAEPGELPPQVVDAAAAGGDSSLPYVAGCTDTHERVPTSRIPELVADFEQQSPTFGRVLAMQILECSSWSTTSGEPLDLDGGLPLLLLTSSADPSSGGAPTEPLAGALSAAGIDEVTTVTWRSPGAGLVRSSECVRGYLADFLADPVAAEPGVCHS